MCSRLERTAVPRLHRPHVERIARRDGLEVGAVTMSGMLGGAVMLRAVMPGTMVLGIVVLGIVMLGAVVSGAVVWR